MWKHSYGFVCALVVLVIGSAFVTLAQTVDPSTQPLIQLADLTYVGAFRLPRGYANGDSFLLGGAPLAFNPSRNSLFVGNHRGNVAEVAIPAPVNSTDVTKLPFATFIQAFYEPTEGALAVVAEMTITLAVVAEMTMTRQEEDLILVRNKTRILKRNQ